MASLNNKKIAILGYGIEGKDAAIYCLDQKAQVTVFDRKKYEELDLDGTDPYGLKFVTGDNYLENGLREFDIVIRSPGVYRFIPEITDAEKAGVVITSPVKLFFDSCPGKIIGVTGTKGKGTTSTLIYEILKKEGKDVYLAGNIGYPVLELLPKLKKHSLVVLELSSFQLIDMEVSPHIAVVLNITEDHLDWHKDRKEYLEAKTQIVRHQKASDFAILNNDYVDSKNFAQLTASSVFYFSRKVKVNGSYVHNGKVILHLNNKEKELGKSAALLLRGEHNSENVTAAVLASYLAGASLKSIKSAVFSFKGLEHRLELVGWVGKVQFYNDSFSTNPQTTIAAVKSFTEPITLILGGFDKKLNYDEMANVITKSTVGNVVLIGDIRKKIKTSLTKASFKGNVRDLGYKKMPEIVQSCFEFTPKGGVVLLSPASSSFDMFENYKVRGNEFKKEVNDLK